MFVARKVTFPWYGGYPGVFSLVAQEPENEFRGQLAPIGPNGLGSVGALPDLGSVSLFGMSVPILALGAAALAIPLLFMGGKRKRSAATYKARRVARLQGELAAAKV